MLFRSGSVLVALSAVFVISTSLSACTSQVPHLIWRKNDVSAAEVNEDGTGGHVLIAARSSEYKEDVVTRVTTGLEEDDVHVSVIGVEDVQHGGSRR